MAITDAARNHLCNKLREALGAEDAETLMDMLPPVGWADVARQPEVDRRFADVDRQFAEVHRRLEEVHRRFDDLPKIFATKDDLREQTRFFVGTMVASNAVLVAAVSLIVGLTG